MQEFDSISERRFAVIAERDAEKWFRPVKGQFQIFYKVGVHQPEYVTDSAVETDGTIYMVETKARSGLKDEGVLARSAAAAEWCENPSNHTSTTGGKPWTYLLGPHDEINDSRKISSFEMYTFKCVPVEKN